jgi:hypothetical protein
MYNKVVGLFLLAFVVSLATGAAGAGRAEPVPVGWWRLDGNAEDSSGNENHGTVAGSPQWVAGKFDGALEVNGSGDHVDCGNGPSLNITGPLTISAWVHPTGPGSSSYPRVVDKSNGTGGADPGYKLYVRSGENYIFTLSAGGVYFNSSLAATLNTWHYVAFVITGAQWKLYVDEASEQWDRTDLPSLSTNPLCIGESPAGGRPFQGLFDDVRIYDVALTDEEIAQVMKGPLPPGAASKPIPATGDVDVPRDVTLRWTSAKEVAASNGHIVYLSQNFQDVNDGVGGVRQSDATYETGQLDFGATYYWRVDEVSASGGTIPKGQVWSFTVEPYAYPVTNVTATASSAQADMGPENTINGSGLNAEDQHGVTPEQMWLSDGTLPNWIQYEFDQVYKLQELWVWNSNQLIEGIVGFGAKDVTIEYSQDGQTWTALAGVPEFARAPGAEDYAHNTTVDFGGVLARYVKLTINSTWGVAPLGGLSEVRFFYVPVRAREPLPADAATDLALSTLLNWRPGREAASHTVYLSKDQDTVANGTAPATTVATHSFAPADLEFGASYYWRVDEVNEARTPAVYEGPVWTFHTQEYAVIDDFESYTDDEGSRIYEAWVDGFGTTTNGSQVGYVEGPFAERTIVHGGEQSMPLFFNNTAGATYSEAELTLSPAQDWTTGGAKTLALWFYGDPDSTGAQLYAKVNGSKVMYDGDAADLQIAGWRPWNISLAAFGGNLQKVTTLALGVDGSGAAGKFYFDDIRLYPRERQLITPVEPGTTGLVAYYKLDKDGTDSSGNQNNGTVVGNPPWVAGKVDGAVQLDGRHDYIDCGNGPTLNLTGPMTIAAWVHPTGTGSSTLPRIVDKSNGTGGADPGFKLYLRSANDYILTLSAGGVFPNSTLAVTLDTWNHVAWAVTGTEWRLSVNGTLEQFSQTELPSISTNPLYIGNSPAGDRHFEGLMDEVRIYNRALTPAELAWLAGRTAPFDLPF